MLYKDTDKKIVEFTADKPTKQVYVVNISILKVPSERRCS